MRKLLGSKQGNYQAAIVALVMGPAFEAADGWEVVLVLVISAWTIWNAGD